MEKRNNPCKKKNYILAAHGIAKLIYCFFEDTKLMVTNTGFKVLLQVVTAPDSFKRTER